MFDKFTFDEIVFDGRGVVQKTLTEDLQVFGGVGNWNIGKLLIQQTHIVANFLTRGTFIKALVESFVVVPIYSRVLAITRTLSETVQAIGNIAKQTGRVLTESLIVVSEIAKITDKTLVQAIQIGLDISNQVAHTFIENVKVGAEKIKQAGHILLENLTGSDTIVLKSVLNKYLFETINIVSALGSFVIGKLFIQPVKVISGLINMSTLHRVLEEVVVVSDKILKQTGRILTETLVIISEITKSIGKIFAQIIQTGSKIANKTAHMFVERILGSSQLTKIFFGVKVFGESIKIGSQKLFNIGRIFHENVNVVGSMIYLRMRILTETISIGAQTLFNISRLFVENIKVNWEQLSLTTRNYIEHISVHAALSPFVIAKLLIQRIRTTDKMISNYIQFTVLVEHLNIVLTFTKRMFLAFTERVEMAADVIIKYIGRFLTESIVVNGKGFQDELQLLFGHVFSEALKVIDTLGNWVIGKLLKQTTTVGINFTKVWTLSRVFTEAINVAMSYIGAGTKVLIEAIQVASSYARKLVMQRLFIHIVKIHDSILPNHILYKVLSDSLKVAHSIVFRATRVFYEVVQVGQSFLRDIGKLLLENININEFFEKIWQMGRLFTERIQVVGNAFNQNVRIFIETIKASDTFIRGALGKALYETIQISQIITKSLPKVFAEVMQVVGNGFNQAGKIFTEGIMVAGQFILGTISKMLIEVVKIVQNFTKVWTLSRVFTEVAKVGNLVLGETSRIFTETINVASNFVLGTIYKLLIEIVNVGYLITNDISRMFVEIANVGRNIVKEVGRTLTQAINMSDPTITKLIGKIFTQPITVGLSLVRAMSRTFAEEIKIASNYVISSATMFVEQIRIKEIFGKFNIGKLLTEAVSIRTKLKFVLNGIQVGLWRKVARITGTWRKWGRTE